MAPRYNDKARGIAKDESALIDTDAPKDSKGKSMSSKKRKRFEKFLAREEKKKERVKVLNELSKQSFPSGNIMSSAKLSRKRKKNKIDEMQTTEENKESDGYDSEESIAEIEPKPTSNLKPNNITPKSGSTLGSDLGSALAPVSIGDKNPASVSNTSFKQWATAQVQPRSSTNTASSLPPKLPSKEYPLSQNALDEAEAARIKTRQQDEQDDDITIQEDQTGDESLIPKTVNVPVYRSEEMQVARAELPIIGEEMAIMDLVKRNLVVVLCGETGSGKTTQVPQFLYEAGWGNGDASSDNPGMIGITQPRRVAAMSMAKRVGEEMNLNEDIISYQIRYDGTVSNSTKIKFMTDGVLLREMSKDFLLSKYSCIIVDEAHDRTINTDLLLGLVSRVVGLRRKMHFEQPESGIKLLRLIVMSATLRVSDFVENSQLFSNPPPVKSIEGRRFPVSVHFNRTTPEDYVLDAYKKICKIHNRLPTGGILVFLSGKADIARLCHLLRRKFKATKGKTRQSKSSSNQNKIDLNIEPSHQTFQENLEPENLTIGENEDNVNDEYDEHELSDESHLSGDDEPQREVDDADEGPMLVLPLYSQLPVSQQQLIFQQPPDGTRMCIVATNVAETSLTIPYIRYVVDSGKVKEKVYDSSSGVQSFRVNWISKASAEQRMGRAGRTQAGHCYRLYSSALYDTQFAEYPLPEIMRTSIEGVVLQMKSMNIDRVSNFPFPTSPDRQALQKSERDLKALGGLNEHGHITELGKTMSIFPVSPRFAKMLILSQQYNCAQYIIALVAAFSVGELFTNDTRMIENQDEMETETKPFMRVYKAYSALDPSSDVFRVLGLIGAYDYENDKDKFCLKNYLQTKAMHEVSQLRNQLVNMMASFTDIDEMALTNSRLMPPNEKQKTVIKQVVCAAFIGQIAIRANVLDKSSVMTHEKLHSYKVISTDELVYIHPSSSLQSKSPPIVVYQELRQSSRLWIKDVTEVEIKWLWFLGKHMCSIARVLDHPQPKVNSDGKTRIVNVVPLFRPFNLDLPVVQVRQKKSGTRWVME